MARLLVRERGGPHPALGGGACPRLRAEESPERGVMGGRAARATGGTPGWLGGTAPDRVWSAQIPGGGSNLACPVWLSPDTRGPAMRKPRQNHLALDGAAGRLSVCSGPGVEEARQEGPRRPHQMAGRFTRGNKGQEGFWRKGFYSDRNLCPLGVTSPLLRCPWVPGSPQSILSADSPVFPTARGPTTHQTTASQADKRRLTG